MARPHDPKRRHSAPALGLVSRLALVVALVAPSTAIPQDRGVSYTFYGTPGLLEMPSAISANDGEFAGTLGAFGGQLRNSFTVQVTPRFSGTFRYGRINGYAEEDDAFYDRSFDLRYRFTDEGRLTPMIAVGLQDFLGTGIYGAEYLVATKTLNDSIRVTGGLGWGRLATGGGFTNPLGIFGSHFEDRPDTFDERDDTGGTVGADAFFRGDAALFGGIEWAATERLTFKAEYSSDDGYNDVDGEPLFDRASPLNFGVSWRPLPGIQLGLGYLYGTQLAFSGTITVNPNERPFWSGLDAAPQPVAVRAGDQAAALSWDRTALPEASIRTRLQAALRTEGVALEAVELTDRTARLRYTNTRYRTEAQAMGRVVRILTQELPPSIERFTLEPVEDGVPLSAVTFARSDIEALENEVGGTAASLDRAVFADAGRRQGLTPLPPVRDAFTWGIRPFVSFRFFDPNDPIQINLGAEASASYHIRPNLVLEGSVRQRIITAGDSGGELRTSDTVPVVRRNAGFYGQDGTPYLRTLTLAHYARPGRDLYSRVSVGYLESMYGGVSGEVLYKPVESRMGLGAEVNYAVMRDFDQLLGFQDYDVVTGHASVYYDLRNGFHGQIDAGRFLAGDWGATFSVDREFDNGWRVGGFFTLTDIPFEDYGEGSFDKGVTLTIPTDFVFGRPSTRVIDSSLSSLNRDGGSRLNVDGRLYDTVRDAHYGDLEDSWGRFWR